MKSPKSGLEDARTADRQFQADEEWDSLRDSTYATHRPLRKVGGVGETDEGDKESKSSSANSTAEGSLSSGTPDAANVFKYARPLSPVPEDSVEETLALVRSRLRATAEARGERNKGEAEGNSEAISDSGAARPVNTIRGRDVVDFRIPSMSSSWLEHKRVERLLKVVELENLLQAQAIRLVRLIHAENHAAKVHFDVYTATASVLRSIEQPSSPVNKQRVIAKGHYVSMATVVPDPTTGVWHIIKRGTGCFPSRWKSLENFIHELREDLEIRAVMPDKRLPKLTDKPWADGED